MNHDAKSPPDSPSVGVETAAAAPTSRRRRTLRIATLSLLPLLAAAAAWWFTRPDRTQAVAPLAVDHSSHAGISTAGNDEPRPVTLDAAAARRIGVTFAAVTNEPLGREVRAVGQIVVDETRMRTVSIKVDGWVERLYVDFAGQRMIRGAPLLTIYSPMLVTAQEELLLATQLTREVTASGTDTRAGAADLVQSARRRLRWWDVDDEEIARIERTGTAARTLTIAAPTGGVVLEKNVTVGQRVMAGDVLYRVADLSSVWVDGEVYERDLAAIRLGQPVTVTVEALPGMTVEGRVVFIYPTLSADTRTARVRVALPNRAARLMPGMYATLRIESDAQGARLSVPRGAVLATGNRQFVFVRLPSGQLEPRTVTTGASSDDRVAILSGVVLGDTVVASATFLIDAESNLGGALDGAGTMPGMDMPTPTPAPGKPKGGTR